MLRLVFAAALLPVATAALSAAWTLEKGRTQTFVTSSFTHGDHGFDADGNLITVPEYRKFELTAVLEHGVRPWLTAIALGELTQETSDEFVPPDDLVTPTRAFGSVGGGARVRIASREVGPAATVVSTQATAFSGDTDTSGLGGVSEGAGIDMRILVGASGTIRGRPVFGDLQVGFVKRFATGDEDEVKVDATLGARLTPKWMVLAQGFSTFAADGTQSYHKLSGSVVRQVTPRLEVEVGAYRTVAGRDALQETGGRLGVWFTF